MITAFYHPGYAAPIGKHVMPIQKFSLVVEGLKEDFTTVELREPTPITEKDLLRVHTREYVEAIRTGDPRVLAESQKFPWSPELFPSVCLTSGGCLAAAREALKSGVAAALVSGFHHSHADHGEGFCTFNGLVITADALHAEGAIKRIAVLDLDLHYGNGTASLATSRPYIYQLSIYGNDYAKNVPYRDVSERHHDDGPNHESIPIPGGADGATMTKILTDALPRLVQNAKPDLLIFQAGADPLRDDPYSPLNLTHEDLRERDRMVFEFARSKNIPIAWVLAGGYTPDTSKVVRVHLNTFAAAIEIFGS